VATNELASQEWDFGTVVLRFLPLARWAASSWPATATLRRREPPKRALQAGFAIRQIIR